VNRLWLAGPWLLGATTVLGCSAGDPAPAGPPQPGAGASPGSGGAAAGGATAAGGTGASGPSAPQLTPVTPAANGALYAFVDGDFRFEVDPQVGGRITVASLGGVNLLAGSNVHSSNYGSTFWTDPQSVWNWPPPPEIDTNTYAATVNGSVLQLSSNMSADLGVSVNKDFAAWTDGSSGYVTVTYTIVNQSGGQVSFGPWEIARVLWGGLSFFPAVSVDPSSELPLASAAGVQWLDGAATELSQGQYKTFADGSRGWLAHAASGILLVRKFTDLPASQIAAEHGEIELYVQPPDQYLELEVHGANSPIAAGAELAWTVTWIVTRIASTVAVNVGSQDLVDFVDTLVAQTNL
jgi:hypothetical protein